MAAYDQPDLERRFDAAMMEIYERAGAEAGYWATRYLQMLRRRGGLETARYLLGQEATSDGYAHLRDAGRLDLTVEAYSLRPEFQALFTESELANARRRLQYFGEVDRRSAQAAVEAEPELVAILREIENAAPENRMAHRARVTAYGVRAIPVIEWLTADGLPVSFAISAIEAIGREHNATAARWALTRIRQQHQDWGSVIDAAVGRLKAIRPSDRGT
jgi:hypothetical protein